jgi:hypothetical protein
MRFAFEHETKANILIFRRRTAFDEISEMYNYGTFEGANEVN